jgi:uncharacterized damage-inducible protein DinB
MNTTDFYNQCCGNEHGLTRKVIQAVPDDGLDWQPDPTSRTARQLIGHIIGHEQDVIELLDDRVIHHRNVVPFGSIAEALEIYDAACAEVEEKASSADGETWGCTSQFLVGDHVAWEASAGEVAWGMLFDSIHHRGQLSTYLRPLGAKVPAMYGPSADDDGSGAA